MVHILILTLEQTNKDGVQSYKVCTSFIAKLCQHKAFQSGVFILKSVQQSKMIQTRRAERRAVLILEQNCSRPFQPLLTRAFPIISNLSSSGTTMDTTSVKICDGHYIHTHISSKIKHNLFPKKISIITFQFKGFRGVSSPHVDRPYVINCRNGELCRQIFWLSQAIID